VLLIGTSKLPFFPLLLNSLRILIYKITYMEAETLFPKRNGQTDGSFRKLKPVEFATNFYPIILDEKRSKICQYSFDLP
jgi:hypothetical protein